MCLWHDLINKIWYNTASLIYWKNYHNRYNIRHHNILFISVFFRVVTRTYKATLVKSQLQRPSVPFSVFVKKCISLQCVSQCFARQQQFSLDSTCSDFSFSNAYDIEYFNTRTLHVKFKYANVLPEKIFGQVMYIHFYLSIFLWNYVSWVKRW